MFGSIGMPELIIILVIALIIFGPRKLPELGKSLGRSLNEFKKASTDLQNTLEQEIKIEEQKEAADKFKVDENKFKKADDDRRRRTRSRRTRFRHRRRAPADGFAARHRRHSYAPYAPWLWCHSQAEPRRRPSRTCRRSRRLFAVRRSR